MERGVWGERGRGTVKGGADDGKHPLAVIEVDISLLEATGREVWREGAAARSGRLADSQARGSTGEHKSNKKTSMIFHSVFDGHVVALLGQTGPTGTPNRPKLMILGTLSGGFWGHDGK